MNRKERILQYLKEGTERFAAGGFADPEGFQTEAVAAALKLDRANVSKILNDLWNDGHLVKVQGRPTLYLSLRALESALPGRFIPITVAGRKELTALLQEEGSAGRSPTRPDEAALTDGLRRMVQEILPVCSYPPYGMPLVLVSPSQEDTVTVVSHIFEQLKESRPAGARLVTVDCRGSLQGEAGFLQRLFGCSREASPSGKALRSHFEMASHGVVFLVGVHRLPDHILELLLTAIDRGTYCRMGETISRPLDATLILSLPPQRNEELLARLGKHAPFLQTIPPLDSRSLDEKILLILKALGQEAAALGRTLRLDKDVLAYLLTTRYPAGVSELQSVIRLLCASVFRAGDAGGDGILAIRCSHLPQRVVMGAEGQLDRLHHILKLLSMTPNDYLFFSPDGNNAVLQAFHRLWLRSGSLDALPDDDLFFPNAERLSRPQECVRGLLDYLSRCDNARVAQMRKAVPYYVLQSASRVMTGSPAGEPLSSEPVLQLGLLLPMLFLTLREVHLELPEGLPAAGEAEAALCRELFALFSPPAGFALSPREIAYFSLYLTEARGLCRRRQVSLLILCHGEHIASEYAELLRSSGPPGLVVAAVDVSVGESLDDVVEKAAQVVGGLDRGSGVAIAADMPPLLTLAAAISRRTGVACRGVGEVSLTALMDLSEQCAAGRELSEIVFLSREGAGEKPVLEQQDSFMRRYLNEVFAPNLTFLDINKAADSLTAALSGILEDLQIPYGREVAIKFLSHASYMLERVISNRTMHYPNLRRFLAERQSMVSAVDRRLEPVGNTFGIVIPAAEIAYIVEIFLEYA